VYREGSLFLWFFCSRSFFGRRGGFSINLGSGFFIFSLLNVFVVLLTRSEESVRVTSYMLADTAFMGALE
jgi:hypothetical protein